MPSKYDIFIIGGGINGCGIARDAAGRGLAVGLAELGDLAQGTSSASTKLIHGGLRYLEQYEFRLVREALREREILLAIAPHIVHPLRFILPHAPGMRPKWLLRLGLFLYDRIGGAISLPRSRRVDLRGAMLAGALQPQFSAGFEYSDCRVDDARLVILNARDAADRGADILPRTKVVAARRKDGLWCIELEEAGGARRSVHAKALVNAAGPWADIAGATLDQGVPAPRIRLVQGAHIVTAKLYDHDRAYIFQNRDGRIVFTIPYENDFTLIGTTDREISGDPANAAVSGAETDYLIEAANSYFRRQIVRADIVWTFAGVRALADTASAKAQTASRDYRLDLDAQPDGAPLVSVLGGKITSYRTLAAHVLEKLAQAMPGEPRLRAPEWTQKAPLPGGDLTLRELRALEEKIVRDNAALDPAIVRRWAAAYGSQAGELAHAFLSDDGPGRHFGSGLYAAEIRWLMLNEWARTAGDILWRRSKLGLRLSPDEVQAVEAFMAGLAGNPA